jgi:hypothetical protein
MRLTPLAAIAVSFLLVNLPRESCAQAVSVQQPVVQVFGVNTTVVVPDRGSSLLGSVSSAGDTRSTNGFSPFGASIGSFRNHSSQTATVYIHDFEAMDEALLNAGRGQIAEPSRPLDPLAQRAYLSLLRQERRQPRAGATTGSAAISPSRDPASNLRAATGANDLSPASNSSRLASPLSPDVTAKFGGVAGSERFGRAGQSSPAVSSSSSVHEARRSTNSGDRPAASRGSR